MHSVETALGVPPQHNSLRLQEGQEVLGSPLPTPTSAPSPFLSPLPSPCLEPVSPTVDARTSPAPTPMLLGLKEDPELVAALQAAKKGPVIIHPDTSLRQTKGKSVRFRLPVEVIGFSACSNNEAIIESVAQDTPAAGREELARTAEIGGPLTRSETAQQTVDRLKKRASLILPPHQDREQWCQPSIDLDFLSHIESELDSAYTSRADWGGEDLEAPTLSPSLFDLPALSPAPSSEYASSVSSPMPSPLPLSETDVGPPKASQLCPSQGLAAGLGITGLPDAGAASLPYPESHSECAQGAHHRTRPYSMAVTHTPSACIPEMSLDKLQMPPLPFVVPAESSPAIPRNLHNPTASSLVPAVSVKAHPSL